VDQDSKESGKTHQKGACSYGDLSIVGAVRSVMSPIIVRCSECGYILGKEDVELIDLEVLITDLNGKCPKCGHLLTLPPKTVEVKPNPTCKKRLVGDWKHGYHKRRRLKRPLGEKVAGSSGCDSSQGGCADFPHSQQKKVGVGPGLRVLPPPAL